MEYIARGILFGLIYGDTASIGTHKWGKFPRGTQDFR